MSDATKPSDVDRIFRAPVADDVQRIFSPYAPDGERMFFDCCGRMDDEGHAASCKGPLASTLAVKDAEIAHERAEYQRAAEEAAKLYAGLSHEREGRASEAKAHLATMEELSVTKGALFQMQEAAKDLRAGWRVAVECALGAEPDLERHSPDWAFKTIQDALAAKDAEIASLRAALTEAVDSHFDAAAALETFAPEAPEPTANEVRTYAESLRAKAGAWRKVLTETEGTNAR